MKKCYYHFVLGLFLGWLLTGIIFSISGCRVHSPKQKGYVLTPDGFALKDTLTTKEKKEFKEWRKMEEHKLK